MNGMLLLVFRVAGDAYAIEAARVVEVLPRVELRTVPHGPEALAGLLFYRGRMVPVIDLGMLFGTGPSPALLSTRIILANESSPPEGQASVGLIAGCVSEVQRVAEDRVVAPPPLLGPNPYLRSIVAGPDGLLPLVAVDRILADPVRRTLAEAAP
jgi:chemotaxis-related protein WspB